MPEFKRTDFSGGLPRRIVLVLSECPRCAWRAVGTKAATRIAEQAHLLVKHSAAGRFSSTIRRIMAPALVKVC